MTTSGTYSFLVTRDDVIKTSMQFLGKLGENELPTATETSDLSCLLNMQTKQWMGKSDFAPGLKVFTRRRGYLFLNTLSGQYSVGPSSATGWTNNFVNPTTTASAAGAQPAIVVNSVVGVVIGYNIGVAYGPLRTLFWTTVLNVVGSTVTLNANLPGPVVSGAEVYCYQTAGTQPQELETAVLRDGSNQDTPLNIMRSIQEYDSLPNKADPTNIADPVAIYYEFQLGTSNLFTDCGAANDTSKYIVVTYMEPTQDFNNPLDNPSYPQEWFLPLCWGLAKNAHSAFQVSWTAGMESAYKEALAIAQHKDPEETVAYFQCGNE